jgi:taspase (threonine aspartase 1)
VLHGTSSTYRSSRSRSNIRHNSSGATLSAGGGGRVEPDSTAVAEDDDHVTDTVGAVCVDRWGRVAAGSSSGGIGMKFRGRVGPAALIGIGTWIRADEDGIVVATTCSGNVAPTGFAACAECLVRFN